MAVAPQQAAQFGKARILLLCAMSGHEQMRSGSGIRTAANGPATQPDFAPWSAPEAKSS